MPSRVLPVVGAFTIQFNSCFKWRLIPTKEKYEEIREHILESYQLTNGGLTSPVMIKQTFLKMAAGFGQLINLTLLSPLAVGNGFYELGVKEVPNLQTYTM